LGGVPWDITEQTLISAFRPFGNISVEWPVKDTAPSKQKGYCYAIFEHEKQVSLAEPTNLELNLIHMD
jgi:RNA recognition motif-containing protein